jgi:hypothetical protein
MRDEQHRAAGEQGPDRLEQPALGPGVERRGRLVEDHERRVAENLTFSASTCTDSVGGAAVAGASLPGGSSRATRSRMKSADS